MDVDAGELYRAHGAAVLAFAHRMLGDRAEAEDAVQETFLRAHRAAGSFDGGSAPSTWLFAIARNVCLDRLRGRRRVRSLASLEHTVEEGLAFASAAGQGAGEDAERRWYVDAVREGCLLATLTCLTPDQRAAFVLRAVVGMSTADTAAVLGRSENAVRLLTSRARHALKGFLCRNCSVYDPANPCRCENLVGFSRARGWIGPGDRRPSPREAQDAAARAATAIDETARLAAVYATIATSPPAAATAARIREVLGGLHPGPAGALRQDR